MSEKTIFEKIIDREIPAYILHEDQNVIALLDIFPFEKGHVLVVPKTAHAHIWDMGEEEYTQLQTVVHRIAKKIRTELSCDVAVYQRNGVNAGQEIEHVHVHVVPKYQDEQTRPLFGDTMENRTQYQDEQEKQDFVEKLKLV